MKLFTAAEKILFTNNKIDYRNVNLNNKLNLEEFSLQNMYTMKDDENIETRSIILAPFNSSIGSLRKDTRKFSQVDSNVDDLVYGNSLVKYNPKVKELNRNYEFNNNEEIDNGIIISPQGNTFEFLGNESFEDIKSPPIEKVMTPLGELDEDFKNGNTNFMLNSELIKEIQELGYSKRFIINSIIKNQQNYASAYYYLMEK